MLKAPWQNHGGVVLATDENVDTVLIDPQLKKNALQTSYDVHVDETKRQIHVEPTTFVQRCIREYIFCHRPKVKLGMGGRPGL